MTPYEYPELDETLYRQKLPNGLTVCVVPRKGFTRSLAYFVTDYGSVHTDYRFAGKDYRSPAGVAHYLEHKMFDLPDRDVSAEFARLGASTNAFTSYDMTAYYFSCTKNFDACLRLLLEFVSTPYFTAESVEKERGIIDQEIGMNEDAPDSVIPEEVNFRLREEGQNFLRIEHAIHDNTGESGRARSPFLGLQRQAAALSRQMPLLCNLPVHLNAQCFRSLGQGADHQRKLPTAQDFRLRRDKDLSGAAGNLQQTANFGGSVFRKGQHRAAGFVLKDNPMFPNPDHRTPKGDALHARNQPGQLTDGCYG